MLALLFSTLLVFACWEAPPVEVPEPVPAPITCQEDMPCWDCATMGNMICGPVNVPNGGPGSEACTSDMTCWNCLALPEGCSAPTWAPELGVPVTITHDAGMLEEDALLSDAPAAPPAVPVAADPSALGMTG